MNAFLRDLVDRVGSTIVQSLGGSMTAIVASGTLGAAADWRLALVTAGSAGVLSAAKALGVAAASKTPAVVQSGGSVSVDEAAVVKAIAAKLRG